jgi:predicted DNA-binding mobile mystery protein A
MKESLRHLDARFAALKPLLNERRPPKGWIRAIRDALGMTSVQFARRMAIVQSSASELEQAEARDSITLKRLERAAGALGCRVVYALVPLKPLSQVVRDRAEQMADRQIAAIEHTMRLEDQAVPDKQARAALRQRTIDDLLRNPSRLWEEE